jgi:hypothetical protein
MDYIYALVDPLSHEVKYVGQCENLKNRYGQHLAQARAGQAPHHAWIRELGPEKPTLVLLESVARKRIRLPRSCRSIRMSSVMEVKWIKRFRRTALNRRRREQAAAAWDAFVNSPEMRSRFGLE